MLTQIVENFSPGSYSTVLPAYGSVFLLIIVGYMIHFLPEVTKEVYRGYFIRIPLAGQMFVLLVVAVLLYQMRTTDVHAIYLFQILEKLFFFNTPGYLNIKGICFDYFLLL